MGLIGQSATFIIVTVKLGSVSHVELAVLRELCHGSSARRRIVGSATDYATIWYFSWRCSVSLFNTVSDYSIFTDLKFVSCSATLTSLVHTFFVATAFILMLPVCLLSTTEPSFYYLCILAYLRNLLKNH